MLTTISNPLSLCVVLASVSENSPPPLPSAEFCNVKYFALNLPLLTTPENESVSVAASKFRSNLSSDASWTFPNTSTFRACPVGVGLFPFPDVSLIMPAPMPTYVLDFCDARSEINTFSKSTFNNVMTTSSLVSSSLYAAVS